MATETIPVCAEAVIEMETFITSLTPSGADYSAAVTKAFGYFSDSHVTGENMGSEELVV